MRNLLPLLALLLLPAGPVRAGDPRDDLYQAQNLEFAEGDVEGALALYRSAGRSEDPEVALPARLGEARCLRRRGLVDEARRIVEALLAGALSPDLKEAAEKELARLRAPAGAEAGSGDAETLKAELARAREEAAGLRESLTAAEGSEEEIARLKKELEKMDGLVGELTERLRSLAEEGVDPRELARRAELSEYALSQARALYREARFGEAKEWVKRALEQEPTNAEARELWARLGDTLGDRERLIRDVLRLLDLERRIRLEDLRLEVDTLISAGQESLVQGDLDRAYGEFEECIALVDSSPSFRQELAVRRERAREFLDRVALRGGKAPAGRPPPVRRDTSPEAEWRGTLRRLLADLATSARPGGSRLRIFELTGLDGSGPPALSAPATLTLSPIGPEPAPLMASLIPVLFESPGWADGTNLVRSQGSDLIVLASDSILEAISGFLGRLAARQDPPLSVSVTAVAVDPSAVTEVAVAAGIRFEAGDGEAHAELPEAAAAAFRAALLDERRGSELGSLSATVHPGRAITVARTRGLNLPVPGAEREAPGIRHVDYGVRVNLLPARTGPDYGLAATVEVRRLVDTLRVPVGRGGEVQLPSVSTERAGLAVRLEEGRTLVLVGLSNPFLGGELATRPALVLFLGVKDAVLREEAPAGGPPPEEPGTQEESVRVDLVGLDLLASDEPAPPFRGAGTRPAESRTGFLLRYLRDALGPELLRKPSVSFSIARGVVWVRGGEEAVTRVRNAVRALGASSDRMVTIRVRSARLSAADESLQLRGLTEGGEVVDGDGIRLFLLEGEQRRRIQYFAAGTEGRIQLLSGVVAARSTQLVNVSRVTRYSFLRDIRNEDGSGPRPIYDSVDEGIAVEARPVVTKDGEVELRLAVRVARILAEGAVGESGSGLVVERPVQAVSMARLRVTLTPAQSLLITGFPAPSAPGDRRDRLVVLVEATEGMPK